MSADCSTGCFCSSTTLCFDVRGNQPWTAYCTYRTSQRLGGSENVLARDGDSWSFSSFRSPNQRAFKAYSMALFLMTLCIYISVNNFHVVHVSALSFSSEARKLRHYRFVVA